MGMLSLGFDIDEVVFDIITPILDFIELEYGIKLTKDVFKYYDFYKCVFFNNDAKNKEVADSLVKVVKDVNLFANSKPIKNAVQVLNILKKRGHKIHFITNRHSNLVDITYEKFKQYEIPHDSITFLGHGSEKGVVAKYFKLDSFIDDLETNLDSILKYNKKYNMKLLLFDKPWNIYYTNNRVERIYDWLGVLRKIEN